MKLLALLLPLLLNSNTFQLQRLSDQPATIITEVSFLSGNTLLRGWLYKPVQTDVQKLPVIIMAPGFSGIKECSYQKFAKNFARDGLAVLLFDYPNFGESEGSPRQEVDPWVQIQAYRDAISFAASQEVLDANRIGVWGGSYSGGHVLVVSALDSRVKCMVAMTPFISGGYYWQNMPAVSKGFLTQQFNADRLSRINGGKPAAIPVVSNKPNDFCAIAGANAFAFVESFKANAPTYRNEVTLKSLEMQLAYEPGIYAPFIPAIPKLFIIAREDEMIPQEQIQAAFDKSVEPKALVFLDGHHFSPYTDKLEEASMTASNWFKKHL